MVYAKAATGYQPGGPNVVAPGLPPHRRFVDAHQLRIRPEDRHSHDNRVLFDLVAYQIDWEDIQVASQVNGVSGLVNGGQATSRGVEGSLQWRPIDGLTARPQRRLQRREHRRGLPDDHRVPDDPGPR